MTLYNKTNNFFENLKKEAKNEEDKYFIDDVVTVKYGGYTIGLNWDYVDKVLQCFDDNEDFDIREVDGVFFIQGICGKCQKRKFEAVVNGDLEGNED